MRQMKRKCLCVVLALALCLCALPVPVRAEESGNWTAGVVNSPGGGYLVEGDIITISSAEGLAWLAVQVNGLNGVTAESFQGKTVVLGADIDLAGKLWTPIGTDTTRSFRGNFDGQNHTISNMTIDADHQERYVGLFGEVFFLGKADTPSFIRNVSLTNATITTGNITNFSYVGVLAGETLGGFGEISGCTAGGQIVCQSQVSSVYVGGLIGYMNAMDSGENITQQMEKCSANVEIQGTAYYAGGLAGALGGGSAVENCGATGSLVIWGPGSNVGGFLGAMAQLNGPVRVKNCYATGAVSLDSGDNNYAGGFVGSVEYYGDTDSYFGMENCMSSGSVSLVSAETGAMKFGGGFVGSIMGQGTVINCYATGNVTVENGSASIGGGFAGNVQGLDQGVRIQNCYEAGDVSASGDGVNRAFGFSGNTPSGTFENCIVLGTQMKAEGGNASVSPFLSSSKADVTVDQCGYTQTMDFGTLTPADGGQANPDALDAEQIKARFQVLSDGDPAWKMGSDGYPILTQVREDVQQTEKLDYLYPAVTFDSMDGNQPVVQSVKSGMISRPEDPVRDGYYFEGWFTGTDGGTTLADTPFDFNTHITTDLCLYAKWTAVHVIQVTANPADGGTVTGDAVYKEGEEVMVTATPGTGYRFVCWTENGMEVSTDLVYRFSAVADRNLTAEFETVPGAEYYQITVSANSAAGGTVTGGGTYVAGVVATVTAIPNQGYRFVHWTENGTEVSSSAGYHFTVSGNRILMAEFETAVEEPVNPEPENPEGPSTDHPNPPVQPGPGDDDNHHVPPVDPIEVPGNNGQNRPGSSGGQIPGSSGGNNGTSAASPENRNNAAEASDPAGGIRRLDRTPNTGVGSDEGTEQFFLWPGMALSGIMVWFVWLAGMKKKCG